MRKPVTSDITVLQGWPKSKDGLATAREVAEALNMTVFQITARLKGMEGREFVLRKDGKWSRTAKGEAEAKNPSPSVVRKSSEFRKKDAVTGQATAYPDDNLVPLLRLSKKDWAPSLFAFEDAQKRLPKIEQQLDEHEKIGNKHGIMVLETELEHCREILSKPRKGKWTTKRIKADGRVVDVIVGPDSREYVSALPMELADVRIHVEGFRPVRLRLWQTSALARKDERVRKETEARKEAKKEQRQQQKTNETEEANTVLSANDTGWRHLTPAERKTDKFRSKAESAFYNLPTERRDSIRSSGKYGSYEEWYKATLARATSKGKVARGRIA